MKVSELRVGVLFYIVGIQSIYVNVVNQTGDRHVMKLAGVEQIWSSLDQLIKVLQEPLRCSQSEITETLQLFSHKWGKLLLPPLNYLESFDVLIFIPHHTLHYVPFHLISMDDGYQYVGTRFGISYCSSATLFTRAVERNVVRHRGVSNWDFSLLDATDSDTQARDKVCSWLGVDIIGQNNSKYNQLARDCASYFSESRNLSGRGDLKNPFHRDVDVTCLVCHGYVDTFNLNNSGVLLSSLKGIRNTITIPIHFGTPYYFRDLPMRYIPPSMQPRQEYDSGPVEAELMTITEVKTFVETQAQLVMLLGCSTGGGQILSGDSFGSLAYQWLQAGAASVLAHQWEADFEFVSKWIHLFLENWINKRQPKAIAMRESVKHFVEQNQNHDETLHIWGAVTLLGDWL